MLSLPDRRKTDAARITPHRLARWWQANRPDLGRLSARDWLALTVFAVYKLVLAASLVYVWVHVWWVLVEVQGQVMLLAFVLLVVPSLVHYWRPLMRCWRKATEPALLTEAARLLAAQRWETAGRRGRWAA